MNSLNQIILEGNVVRQPEKKALVSGSYVCTMPIAVNRKYKGSDGQAAEEVSYFDIETFGTLADACFKWCPKGRGVRVVGRLKQNRWKDDSGKSHSKVKIIAEHVEFKPMFKKAGEKNNSDEPLSADLGKLTPTKKQKLAMLAEVAAATQHEQESCETVF